MIEDLITCTRRTDTVKHQFEDCWRYKAPEIFECSIKTSMFYYKVQGWVKKPEMLEYGSGSCEWRCLTRSDSLSSREVAHASLVRASTSLSQNMLQESLCHEAPSVLPPSLLATKLITRVKPNRIPLGMCSV